MSLFSGHSSRVLYIVVAVHSVSKYAHYSMELHHCVHMCQSRWQKQDNADYESMMKMFFLKGGRIPIFSQTFPRQSVRKHPHTQEVMPVKAETVKCFSLRKRWTALCLHVGWGISDILRSYWDLVHKYWKISRQIGAPSTVIWMLFQRPYTVLHYYYSS